MNRFSDHGAGRAIAAELFSGKLVFVNKQCMYNSNNSKMVYNSSNLIAVFTHRIIYSYSERVIIK